ncbi:hypothetical protein [Mesorhizobium sp.]|uniref:hypothetical protein n=1 Tax=Mesorhizobium sp. TaxID=1871066 RepID=UPI000FE8AF10|nr:hypothetical protein [Mesorhizobium sp.]RWK11863.1 MAG: hypothetical protein EOR39_07030 [Mesorhizobium sp.]TIQ49042.1 MAG: hypothetical protein E5X47_14540 [Mesorhizobium sp.]TIQ58879.1 MAG: hypothetical protein E5X46_09865 [Mesorhizobium sp.]
MSIKRRMFLIGVGGLLTSAFVGEALAFARKNGEPLILPARKPEETLYIYEQEWSDDVKWRVSLGPDEFEAPPPPTWREHLIGQGYRLATEADVERVCSERDLRPNELDTHIDGFGWEDLWDNINSPQARAYHLLKGLDLGSAPNSRLEQAGHIIFADHGGAPGNSYTWVDIKDDLSVSLLQARLIELDLPIRIAVGERA